MEFRRNKFLWNRESTMCNEYTKQLLRFFYGSTYLQITITVFGKIFSREELLVDLAVFPEIRQIKLMIRWNKFP